MIVEVIGGIAIILFVLKVLKDEGVDFTVRSRCFVCCNDVNKDHS